MVYKGIVISGVHYKHHGQLSLWELVYVWVGYKNRLTVVFSKW